MRITVLFLAYYSSVLYAVVNPLFGLLFFVHITILRPDALVWDNIAFGRLHIITGFTTLIAYLVHRKKYQDDLVDTQQRNNVIIFLSFVLWLLIVTILAQGSLQLSLDKFIEVTKIFVLCFLFAKLVRTRQQIELYTWVTLISFGMLSFWGILQSLSGNYRLDTLSPGGSNYIAAQLALMAPFALAKIFDRKLSLIYRLVFLACALSIGLCCVYTNSRGGFLGLSAGILVFISLIKQRFKILIMLAILTTLLSPLLPDNYSNRIDSIFAEEGRRDISAESRPVLWEIAFRIWKDHPIAGVGLENFSLIKDAYIDKMNDTVPSDMVAHIFNRQRYPHGLYPGMMAETGLVGIGLFLILLFRNAFCRFPASFVKSQFQQDQDLQVKGAQAGVIGFAIAALFGDFQYTEILYLQLFFIGAVRGYANSLLIHIDADKS